MIVGCLFVLLTAVRYFEHYFYDPLQTYFDYDYLHTTLPELNTGKLLFHIFLRYTLNAIISIGIIWVAFRKKTYISFSIYFFSLAFFILIIAFWFTLQTRFENYYLFGFYVRRFLIHPVFIIVLLPAFYYQLKKLPDDWFNIYLNRI